MQRFIKDFSRLKSRLPPSNRLRWGIGMFILPLVLVLAPLSMIAGFAGMEATKPGSAWQLNE